MCGCCGGRLLQLGLSDKERAGMEEELLRRVGKRRADLEEFSAWLDARPAFDVRCGTVGLGGLGTRRSQD